MIASQTIGVCAFIPGIKDAHGNPKRAWSDPVPTKVYGYGPRSADGSAETYMRGRDVVTVGLSVYAPSGTAVGPLDRVMVDGVTYEVDGEIADWGHGPFGWQPGIVVSLKRVEG